jgi:hypothetical protein
MYFVGIGLQNGNESRLYRHPMTHIWGGANERCEMSNRTIKTSIVGVIAALLAVSATFSTRFHDEKVSAQMVQPVALTQGTSAPETGTTVIAPGGEIAAPPVSQNSGSGPGVKMTEVGPSNMIALSSLSIGNSSRPPAVNTAAIAPTVVKNNPWANIDSGALRIRNNIWGAAIGEQLSSTIKLNADGTFGWTWSRPASQENIANKQVQPIYPSVRIGGSPWEASKTAVFPIRIGEANALTLSVSYAYPALPTGTYDLAYDMFFSNTNQTGPTAKPNAEMMIWLHGNLGLPQGCFRGDFTDGINSYGLYSFVMGNGRQYFAFILNGQPQVSANFVVDAGKLLNVLNLDPTWFIQGIEFGNEIISGSGEILVTNFTVTLNGHQV